MSLSPSCLKSKRLCGRNPELYPCTRYTYYLLKSKTYNISDTPKIRTVRRVKLIKSLIRKLPELDKYQDNEGEDILQVPSEEKCQSYLPRKVTTQRLSIKPPLSRCVHKESGIKCKFLCFSMILADFCERIVGSQKGHDLHLENQCYRAILNSL